MDLMDSYLGVLGLQYPVNKALQLPSLQCCFIVLKEQIGNWEEGLVFRTFGCGSLSQTKHTV